MMYLRLVDGAVFYYSELYIEDIIDVSVIPFDVGNPFETYGQDENEKPRGNIGVLQYSKNMLRNFGRDLIDLLMIAGISLVVTVLAGKYLSYFELKSSQD